MLVAVTAVALAAGTATPDAGTKTTTPMARANAAEAREHAPRNRRTPPGRTATGVTGDNSRIPRPREIDCLASAIWHEAGNQRREGRVAVAEVVIARTRSRRYPSRICTVIAQRAQFSFVRRGVIPSVPADRLREMRGLATDVISGRATTRMRGALYFHATYVSPSWRRDLRRAGRIGSHVFYRGHDA